MLQIKVNNQFLDLGKVSITFELLSPIFNEIGSFSYPFTLPATANNKNILGHPQRINLSNAAPYKNPAQIIWNGIVFKNGLLITKETSPDYIKAYIAADEGYFYNLIKDLKLNEIDLGGDRVLAEYYHPTELLIFNDDYDKVFPEVDFTLFPLYAPNFHKDKSFYQTWLNYNNGIINRWNTSLPAPIGYFTGAFNTFVPFPFLNYIFNRIASQFNISISDNVFYSDQYLRQLVVFRLFSFAENIGNEQMGDIFNNSSTFNLADGLADISLSDFFQQINTIFKAELFFNNQNNSFKLVLFKDIYNSEAVSFENNTFKIIIIDPNTYDGFEMTYQLDGSDDFLEDHYKDISLFTFKSDIPTFIELPASPDEGDMYFIEAIRAYYYWVAPRTYGSNTYYGEWRFYSNDRDRFTEGNKQLKINIPGVFSRPENGLSTQAGNEGELLTVNERFFKPSPAELRLLFFYGLNSANVPHGGAFITENWPYSLEWSGDNGLREKFYKEWIAFHQTTRQAEFEMPLTASELKNIDFSKKYRFSGADWLFSKINFTMTNNRITPAKVIAWKI